MEFIQSQSSFKYCGTPVTRTRYRCDTIFGEFAVFEACNGNIYVRHPYVASPYYNQISGFDNGLEEWFGPPKKPIATLQEGFDECEAVITKLKGIVANY